MKITTKGQVTIPQELREKTGMMPGCEVEFLLKNNQLIVRKKNGLSRGEEWVRMATGKGSGTMTTDEIMALTRGED